MDTIRFGILGSGSISRTHVDTLAKIPGASVEAVFSRNLANAKLLAEWKGIPKYSDIPDDVISGDVDVVINCLPNFQHAEFSIKALQAGKYVILEKPVAMSLEETDALLKAEKESGKRVFYAEELPFIPKFARAKELVDEGAVGKVYMVRQVEKHSGPYSPWFFQRETAGGGALMDMGCHGIELIRWFLGDADPVSVYAMVDRFVHDMDLDDHAVVNMRFKNDVIGISESSWTLQGGMDSILEVHGDKGTLRVDLMKGSGLSLFSGEGYGMLPDENKGWTNPAYNEELEHGYTGELLHFMDCIRTGNPPVEGLSQGRACLAILLAAYESARTGKTVPMPFEPVGVKAPVDLWKE